MTGLVVATGMHSFFGRTAQRVGEAKLLVCRWLEPAARRAGYAPSIRAAAPR
jgi:hypothetical protein